MGFLVLAFGLDHGLQDLGIAHRLVAGLLPVTPAFQAQERLLVAPLDESALMSLLQGAAEVQLLVVVSRWTRVAEMDLALKGTLASWTWFQDHLDTW